MSITSIGYRNKMMKKKKKKGKGILKYVVLIHLLIRTHTHKNKIFFTRIFTGSKLKRKKNFFYNKTTWRSNFRIRLWSLNRQKKNTRMHNFCLFFGCMLFCLFAFFFFFFSYLKNLKLYNIGDEMFLGQQYKRDNFPALPVLQ